MTQNRHEGAGQVFPPHIDPRRAAEIQDSAERKALIVSRHGLIQKLIGTVQKSGYLLEQQARSTQSLFEATITVADSLGEPDIALSALLGMVGKDRFVDSGLIHELEKEHPGAAMEIHTLAETIRVDRMAAVAPPEVVPATTTDFDAFDANQTAYIDIVDSPAAYDAQDQVRPQVKLGRNQPVQARTTFEAIDQINPVYTRYK